jgi:hypothetical protein
MTVALSIVAIVGIYAVQALVKYILRPYRTPLAKLQGPPIKHWFLGHEDKKDKVEAKDIQKAANHCECGIREYMTQQFLLIQFF